MNTNAKNVIPIKNRAIFNNNKGRLLVEFQDTLKALNKGSKVRYKGWGTGIYLFKDSVYEVWLAVNNGSDQFHYCPQAHELDGEWELYEPKYCEHSGVELRK